MNTSNPASFVPDWVMPNSAACLIVFTVSVPALQMPITFALLACACSRNELKSVLPGNGWRTEPMTLPPALVTKAVVSRSSAVPNA